MNSLSSSFSSTDTSHNTRLTTIEGRYATTGSNIFKGNQTITGSLYISQNLIVQGSSSLENITASAVSIGTNKIILNSNTPAIRYAGISVFDSGSANVTASLFYDSLTNNWKFQHSDVGTDDASILLYGPLGTGIDNAPTLVGNFLTKVEDNGHGHHLTTSSIFDNGSKISLKNNTEITGSLIVAGGNKLTVNAAGGDEGGEILLSKAITNTTLAGEGVTIDVWQNRLRFFEQGGNARGAYIDISSLANGVGTNLLGTAATASYIEYSNVANKPTLVSGSSQILNGSGIWSGSAQLPSGVVSGSAQVSFSTISDKPTLVSGSSQIAFTGLSSIPGGLVSGSSQIDLTATTNYSSGILTRLNAVGVFSGSAQVTGIGNSQLTNSSFNIGTTSISLGRASAAQTLSGVSVDGSSASSPTLTASGALTTQSGSGTLIHSSPIVSSETGLFSTGDNSNSIITFNRHPGNYYSQLGFNSTGGIFYRSFNNTAINTSQAWQTVWTSSSLTNLNQLSNGPGYITGISFANVSSKPTTISGYGITDAITTGNIGSQTVASAGNSTTVGGITPIQFFNNMGDNHGTRTSFDASTPSYNFGFRYVQGTTNGPAAGGGSQFYSWYIGLGNDYPATGGGSYGMQVAIPRTATTPYMSVRYNENNSLGSWIKIAAGYADSAGSVSGSNVSGNISGNASNITSYTINQSVGTGNNVKFASHCDLNISGSAFRFYDGSTFRGGLGLDDWAHSGSAANITVFATGVLHFTSGGSKRAYFDTSGHFLPQANNTYNLGSSSLRWANIYTNDLHLSNENKEGGNEIDGTTGNWTIQEGQENLYIINNKNGKKFKINLTEII